LIEHADYPQADERSIADGLYGTELQLNAKSGLLTWNYNFWADHNQDGLVVLEDLLPLVFYLSKDHNFNWVGAMNAIPSNWLESLDGYNVYATSEYELHPGAAWGDNGEVPLLEPIGHVPLNSAEGDWLTERLRFSFTVPDPQPGLYLWLRPTFRAEVGKVIHDSVIQIPSE
jgi:hypothetical protein